MLIEAGKPLILSSQQQEAVVVGVTRWLKESASAQFGEMRGARNSRGVITVCGTFVGVLQGTAAKTVFVLVDIRHHGRRPGGGHGRFAATAEFRGLARREELH